MEVPLFFLNLEKVLRVRIRLLKNIQISFLVFQNRISKSHLHALKWLLQKEQCKGVLSFSCFVLYITFSALSNFLLTEVREQKEFIYCTPLIFFEKAARRSCLTLAFEGICFDEFKMLSYAARVLEPFATTLVFKSKPFLLYFEQIHRVRFELQHVR